MKRNHISFFFMGIFLFIFLFSGGITFVFAQGGGNQGSGYQGQQPPKNGPTEYQFSNNNQVNMSSNVAIDLNMKVSENVANRFVDIVVNNSQTVALQLQIQEYFDVPPQNRLHWRKVQGQHSTQTTTTSPGNPGPGPHALSDQSSSLFANNDESFDTEDKEINFTYNTYFLLTFNSTIEFLQLSTILDAAQGLNPDNDYVWILFNNATNLWEMVESNQEGPSLSIQLDGTEFTQTQYILTIATLVPITPTIPFWETTTGIIIIIAGLIALAIGLLMSRTDFRNYLYTRIIDIEKGAHRLTLDEVLENEKRDEIIQLILEMPGIHFNELLRQTDLAPGNLVWHLDILETFKIIRKQRVGQYLIYFPYLDKNPISKLDLKLQKSKTTLEILQLINDHPGIYQNQLAARMSMDHKTIQYHLNKLAEVEVIRFETKGRKRLCYPVFSPPIIDSEIENLE